eukprot:m.107681 g.107681  ORF g.107681 m.107681 type:complete len:262 (+) comp15861_c0_seq3:273-1058(+)
MRRAYYSAVSFIDSQIGRLLDTVDELDLWDNTVVVFMSDHGYHLGENGMWLKRNNFENSARVPLMLHVPGMTQSHGKRTNAIVELVDLGPTVTHYAGIAALPVTDGQPIIGPVENPGGFHRMYAISQYHRCPTAWTKQWTSNLNCGNIISRLNNRNILMGYSLRSAAFRFTAWFQWNSTTGTVPLGDSPFAVELYEHELTESGGQFEKTETHNLALEPSYETVLTHHYLELRSFLTLLLDPVPPRLQEKLLVEVNEKTFDD